MANQVSGSPAERTFQYQSGLPSLPLPTLEDSLAKYLGAVRPFASPEEYQTTAGIVGKFGEGIGKELHQKLLLRAKMKRNWLEEWWLDSAYLELRMPSQLNVNFGGPAPYLEHCWPPTEGAQLHRTSITLWHTLQYWNLIRTERLPAQKAGNLPYDMDQFRMLFCTCKVPGVVKDTILNYFKTESEGTCPSHVVVMCRGRIFTFDALCDGQILSPPELLRQLSHVKQCCEGEGDGDGVSALTSEERTSWARLTLQTLTGDPTIRWGDKSYNLLCFADGTFGSHCDHAPFDAMVLVTHCYHLDQQIKATDGRWKGTVQVRPMALPEELVFTVDDRVRTDIKHAKQQYLETASQLQVVCCAFTSFGKAAIKQRKLHPDTFVQLALQLAYYKLHGRPGSCYETATTRRFYHGRTETMRPCTLEAQQWCRAMLDPAVTDSSRRRALGLAFNKHNSLMADAQNGKGFDRHLLGLCLIAREEGLPTPDLFTDPLYAQSGGGGNFVLSTSLVGYTTVMGAVAPMVHQGYGFFYQIRDDRILASCTAWKSFPETDAETMFHTVCVSMHEILQLATTAQL